jgi:hypothetical protein
VIALWKIFLECSERSLVTILCPNGITIESDDINTLMGFENTDERRIEGLTFYTGYNIDSNAKY